jgi:dTDP-4-dehydrorhamnose 3,5-epimerase
MRFEPTEIASVIKVTPSRVVDERGYFSELFRADLFTSHVGPHDFVQENLSRSHKAGTIRGLHFQIPPAAQGKLVRCVRGSLLDIALDIRRGSPTYGRHVALVLSADEGSWLWIPPGFAHGFCTLEPETEILYKVTAPYSAAHDRGIAFNDPDLSIAWPVEPVDAITSQKDRIQPGFSALEPFFSINEGR